MYFFPVLVEPNFFSKNHLLLGKTFLRQKKKEEAKVWLDKAANNNPDKTVDDINVCTLLSCLYKLTLLFSLLYYLAGEGLASFNLFTVTTFFFWISFV